MQKDLNHRYVTNTALRYASYGTPIDTDPHWQAGSNVLCTSEGFAERRPGYSNFENTPTTFTGTIRRNFVWRRWASDFYAMVNEVTATQSKVYKLKIGTDTSYVLIHTSSSTNPFDFVVSSNYLFFGNGVNGDMKKYDGTTVTNWGITAPAAAPTTAASGAGTLDATTGYTYVYCYGNSSTGGLSSPSPASTSTGSFTNNDRNITTVASTDAQVDQIRIFRTTDGGGGPWFEITGSPFANTVGPHADATADTALSSSVAPTGGINDPPIAGYGMVWFANRIWYIEAGSNKVWFTGWEEISNGFAEECVPSGGGGNFWAVDSEAIGLSTTEDSLLIYTSSRIFKISGDSLDTFFRSNLADGLGARERATICRKGKLTAWLDSSNSVWMTDGYTLEELAVDIRPDLESITHGNCSMAFYTNKTFRWLVLLTGELAYCFDFDRGVWNVPWTITANSIHSGETSAGSWDLLIGHTSKKVLKMVPTTYSDNGTSSSAYVLTNLFNMVPDQEPSRTFHMEYVGLETDASQPSTVKQLVDDDPASGTFTDITSQVKDAPNRNQGAFLLDKWYYSRTPAGKRTSIRIDWPNEANNFKLYSIDIATDRAGGR